nr:hypothetical protein [uncultured Desulfobulbus sp.]
MIKPDLIPDMKPIPLQTEMLERDQLSAVRWGRFGRVFFLCLNICRSRKKPRERRSELRNMLISRQVIFRVLIFYEVVIFPLKAQRKLNKT